MVSGQTTSFVYDGDGKRVKSTINGTTTTYFVGAHYEVTGSTVTKYYYAGAQRIAMRTGVTLNYLLGDHLGSTSLTTNTSGGVVSELRYKAWGEVRFASGNMPTKFQYTGQFSYESEFGLYFYNARWYDPSLGRFAQADTIIPNGVQGLERYAYVNNSPIIYADPSGHIGCDEDQNGYCINPNPQAELERIKARVLKNYNVTLDDAGELKWDLKNAEVMYLALINMNKAANGNLIDIIGSPVLRLFKHQPSADCSTCTYDATTYRSGVVNFRITGTLRFQNALHEFGHVIDNFLDDTITNDMESNPQYTDTQEYVYGGNGIGYLDSDALINLNPPGPYNASSEALQHPSNTSDEQWADMWANYVIGNWNVRTSQGALVNQAVQNYLVPYVGMP